MQHEGVVIRADYVEHYPPDTAAAIFWLKNRQPDQWRDKTEVEVNDLRKASDEELEKRLALARAKQNPKSDEPRSED